LKFFKQNNYTEKAKILYFLNLAYFLSLVGLWQIHVLYWTLIDFMWRHTTPFGILCVISKFISSSDNKSVSHWIMFDYFFHVWKVNIFFFLIMFLIYSCSHVSLVGLWQNHVLYWTLIDFMWRHTTPFGKWRVIKYVSVCKYYRSFFHGTLHMWARIDEEHNYLVFLLLSIQSIRPTYFGKTINDWFQFILITFIITEW
jgi:hypothetical protein